MRRIFRLSLLAASVALLWAPHETVPQAAGDDRAARTLLGTNLAQALMHPPNGSRSAGASFGGEDSECFTSKGGVPNLFFLVDSSGSMERLPPDDPATYGKTRPTADPPMPPGVYLDNPTSNTAANTARAA